MKKIIILMMFLILSFDIYARPSEAGVIFLNIAPGARPTGMGEAFVAISDDATATYYNPAGLGFQTGNELTLMHVKWLPGFNFNDMYYDFVAFKKEIDGLGVIGGNITYFYLGEMKRTDSSGNEIGTFNTYEGAATLSYGTSLSKNLSVGINTKFIYSHLAPFGAGDEQGSGIGYSAALDIGLLYISDFDTDFGLSISNIGPKITYIDYEQADPLPTNLKFGFVHYLFQDDYNSLTISGDMNKLLVRKGKDLDGNGKIDVQNDEETGYTDPVYKAIFTSWTDEDGVKDVILGVGTEYWHNDMIGLRAGYWKDEIGKIKNAMTLGGSLKYQNYIFDISYLDAGENHPLTDTMRFSLNIKF